MSGWMQQSMALHLPYTPILPLALSFSIPKWKLNVKKERFNIKENVIKNERTEIQSERILEQLQKEHDCWNQAMNQKTFERGKVSSG